MMKNIVYILCFLLCFACHQHSQKSENATAKEADEFKVERSDLLDDADLKNKDDIKVDFSLDNLNVEIEEKLQANYEATILATKHPEFKDAIKEQLANSDKFNFTFSDSIETIEIKDIILSGNMLERSDSISIQKVLYTTFINSKHTQKDSVLVVMKRTMIVIDNQLKMNTSLTFEKID